MKESVDCQIDFVRRDCGERAVLFFEKYLTEISSQLMDEHCATYTYSDRCNPKVETLSNSCGPSPVRHRSAIVTITITIILSTFVSHIALVNPISVSWVNQIITDLFIIHIIAIASSVNWFLIKKILKITFIFKSIRHSICKVWNTLFNIYRSDHNLIATELFRPRVAFANTRIVCVTEA